MFCVGVAAVWYVVLGCCLVALGFGWVCRDIRFGWLTCKFLLF